MIGLAARGERTGFEFAGRSGGAVSVGVEAASGRERAGRGDGHAGFRFVGWSGIRAGHDGVRAGRDDAEMVHWREVDVMRFANRQPDGIRVDVDDSSVDSRRCNGSQCQLMKQ
jgi:hypothetical protein